MEFKPEILQLAALRQSRGISLDLIAEKTKISRYYLKAIEDLDFAKLPAGVYRDNFVYQYAKIIDEDIADDLRRRLALAAKELAELQAKAMANAGLIRSVKEIITRGTALLFLLGGSDSVSGQTAQSPNSAVRQDDLRLHALRNFFLRHKCPIAPLSAAFIEAADKHDLDWRLLPSIAFLESGGGRVQPGSNPLGWGSGKVKFLNPAQAIHFVAERLARAPIYAGKDTVSKLRTYNPARKDYATRVQAVMDELGPLLAAAR